jgi:hypothetical protein
MRTTAWSSSDTEGARYSAIVSPPSVVKARVDLDEGRPWAARDRLESFVSQNPTHAEALELLGDVLYQMGDLPRAGRYWLLTSRDDDRARRSIDALGVRFARPELVLADLPVRDSVDAYPPMARQRIAELRAEAAANGVEWQPRVTIPAERRGARTPPKQHWWTPFVAFAVVGLILGILVLGTLRLGELAVEAIRRLLGN